MVCRSNQLLPVPYKRANLILSFNVVRQKGTFNNLRNPTLKVVDKSIVKEGIYGSVTKGLRRLHQKILSFVRVMVTKYMG